MPAPGLFLPAMMHKTQFRLSALTIDNSLWRLSPYGFSRITRFPYPLHTQILRQYNIYTKTIIHLTNLITYSYLCPTGPPIRSNNPRHEQKSSLLHCCRHLGDSRSHHHGQRNRGISGDALTQTMVAAAHYGLCHGRIFLDVQEDCRQVFGTDRVSARKDKPVANFPSAGMDTDNLHALPGFHPQVHPRHPRRIHRLFLLRPGTDAHLRRQPIHLQLNPNQKQMTFYDSAGSRREPWQLQFHATENKLQKGETNPETFA